MSQVAGQYCPQLPVKAVIEQGLQSGIHVHTAHVDEQLREKVGVHSVEGTPGFPHPDAGADTPVIIALLGRQNDLLALLV